MAYVGKKRGKQPALGHMAHRIVLCSMKDVIDSSGDLRLIREEALRQWAKIEEKSASLFSPDGQPVKDERGRQTHAITVRALDGVEISSAAWVYEARERRPPRWFKVLSVGEEAELSAYGRFWKLSCRLYERADEITKPAAPGTAEKSLTVAAPLPSGVAL